MSNRNIYNILYIPAIAAFLFFAGISTSYSGNLGELSFRASIGIIDYGDDRDIEIEGKNLNATYAVSGIVAKYGVWDLSNNLVYEKEKSFDDVQPLKDFRFNLGPLLWDKLEIGLSYKFGLTLYADFDEDTSDNSISSEFTVGSPFISRDEAIGITLGYLNSSHSQAELNNFTAFIPQQVSLEGTRIGLNPSLSLSYNLDRAYWLSYVNFNKYDLFSHEASLIKIDAITGEYESEKFYWWPTIGLNYYPDADQEKEDLIFGTLPEYTPKMEIDWVYEIDNNPEPADSVCFIIVTGQGQNARDSSAFIRSGKVVKQEFQSERRGPRLSVDRFLELNNPSSNELFIELEKLKDNYNQIYFYYVGHGDSTDGMVIRGGETYSYYDLFNHIKNQNIGVQNYIFDCCFSGLALQELQEVNDWDDNSVTIVTSSGREQTSTLLELELTTRSGETLQTGVGAFTNYLASCFGDSNADKNGDGMTSIAEAAEWAAKDNPEVLPGRMYNDYMPQIFTHERMSTETSGDINFADSDLSFSINFGLDLGQVLKVSLERGDKLFEQPQNQDIYEISPGRLWKIGLDYHDESDFSVDMRIQYNDLWDRINTSQGIPGLTFRINRNSEWEAHYPSEYDEDNNLFIARGITHFSEWALARIADPTSVKDLESSGVFVENYPNPFYEASNIKVKLENNSDLNVSILDITGNKIMTLTDSFHNAGTYNLFFNGSDLAPGIYLAKITINGQSKIIKIVHSK